MPARLLAQAVILALWAAFTVVLGSVFRIVFGGFVDDWVSGLLLRHTRVEQHQVIEALAPWVFPGLVAALAMWAAYAYGAWRHRRGPSGNAPADVERISGTGPAATSPRPAGPLAGDVGDEVTRQGRAVLGSPAVYSSGERRFMLRFHKRDGQSVYLQKDATNLAWIASARGVTPGSTVDTTALHLQSDYRELVVGELFLARNAAGYVMQGRLRDLRTREIDGPGEDMAIFDYRIVPGQPSIVVAV